MNKILKRGGRMMRHEVLRTMAIGCIILFAILPLLTLATRVDSADWDFMRSDTGKNGFISALWNSLEYTGISALITTVLALIAAYLLNTSSMKHKNVLVVLLTLGMLVPTVSIGLGLKVLDGRAGLPKLLLDVRVDLLGFPGLIIGSVISAFPATFLILYDALRYEDKGPYDAAAIMGISRTSTFFRLTLPYLKTALISAFCACFTLIFSDYGVPMEIQGKKVMTLPMYMYNAFLGNQLQYGRGSIVGFVLLVPAVVSFLFDLVFRDHSVNEKQSPLIRPGKAFNWVSGIIIGVICAVLFIPQLSFISLSVMKDFDNKDLSFSLEHIANIFSNTRGIGLGAYIGNSLKLAGLTALVGTCFAYMLGYLSVRKVGWMGKAVDLLALSTIAIPGMVLGIGFMFLFSGSWLYNTLGILVAVNVFHFLGSPYLLAKNCLSKINSEYEVIGETLGVPRRKIIGRVLIPGSVSTLAEMFSYFFLNSMITISAVAFLCTVENQPLAVQIITYEKNSNYAMQSVTSLIILALNIGFRALFTVLTGVLKKVESRERDGESALSRYEFDMLTWLEKHGRGMYTQRTLSDEMTVSLTNVSRILRDLEEKDYINILADGQMEISEKGLKALEPFRVRKAVILAAGFGSRLAPVTLDTPKPLVKINGVRIIDTLLDALTEKGITNITIVRGYRKEQFDALKEKYPTIQFRDNPDYNVTNNISSAMCALDVIDRCYICEADLYITNPDIIHKYEYCSGYLGAKVSETDDWCFRKRNGCVDRYQMGGTDCYQAYGISYWDSRDSEQLKADLSKVYRSRGGRENLWEQVPLRICRKNYQLEVFKCHKSDIIEIDNFTELIAADPSYANYPGHEQFH